MLFKLFLAICFLFAVTNARHCSDIATQTECEADGDHCLWRDDACNCIGKPKDFIFIVDASGSVGSGGFANAKTFINNAISLLPTSSRVGVVKFSTDTTLVWSLGDPQYGASGWSPVQNAVSSMGFDGQLTDTRGGLEGAKADCLANLPLDSRDKTFILLTDGIPYLPGGNPNPCNAPVFQFPNGVDLILLGVGNNFNTNHLACLTNQFIHVLDYTPEKLQETIDLLESSLCGEGSNVNGDPVVRTLDGMIYEFQGLCSYVYLMDSNNDYKCKNFNKFNKFQIVGSNKPCELGSCLRRAIVYLKKTPSDRPIRVDFIGNEVLVNGVHMTKKISKGTYTFGDGKYELSRTVQNISNTKAAVDVSLMSMTSPPQKQRYITLQTDYGLSVQWNGLDYINIDLKSDFRGKTCGLLGSKDLNRENDLRHPDGSVLEFSLEKDNLTPLEESWLIQSYVHHWLYRQPHDPLICKSSTPRKLCDGKKSRELLVKNMCKGFLSSLASHKNCAYYSSFDAAQQAQFEEKCNHDMCFCYNDDIFSCASYLYSSLLKKC